MGFFPALGLFGLAVVGGLSGFFALRSLYEFARKRNIADLVLFFVLGIPSGFFIYLAYVVLFIKFKMPFMSFY